MTPCRKALSSKFRSTPPTTSGRSRIFPPVMKGVESVEQIDETSLHFRTRVAGIRREYDAQILEQTPDRCIAWVSKDKPRNAGRVTFESLGQDLCRGTWNLNGSRRAS